MKKTTIIVLILVVSSIVSAATGVQPRVGDWVCWYTSKSNSSCGTYGWARSKRQSKKAAKNLCEQHCNTKCKLDYCERLKSHTRKK